MLPHLVEERTLSIDSVLDVLAAMFVLSEVRIEGETQYFWTCACLV